MTTILIIIIGLCAFVAVQVLVTYLIFFEGPLSFRAVFYEILTMWAILFTYPLGYINLDPFLGRGRGGPVLLLHGYFMNRACMFLLQWRLRKKGYSVHTVLIRPIHGSIEELSSRVSRKVEEICPATGKKLILIGHSMGGLVARCYIEKMDDGNRVAQLVTIGTPHSGTKIARLGLGRNAREMRPSSPFLRSLTDGRHPDTKYIAIFSPADNMVIPSENARMDGAENIQTEPLGHLSLLFSPRVFSQLERVLLPA